MALARTTSISLIAALIIATIIGVAIYRFIAGPSWKLPICKPSVTVVTNDEQNAERVWRDKVRQQYGERYANSGITLMSTTVCINGRCEVSARPCAQQP